MKNMLFIMNPKAGRTTLKNSLVDVLEVFCNNDYAVRTYLTKSADDAERIVQEEGANYDVIVCAGGDGTLGNTVTGYMKSGIRVPLGYIPCGSTNDFARSMDIPRETVEAAEMIVKAEPFSIDIGSLNDKNFVYVAAFGMFSDTSYAIWACGICIAGDKKPGKCTILQDEGYNRRGRAGRRVYIRYGVQLGIRWRV